eukprot:14066824-Alexandrium_andersonii.AAC.1
MIPWWRSCPAPITRRNTCAVTQPSGQIELGARRDCRLAAYPKTWEDLDQARFVRPNTCAVA